MKKFAYTTSLAYLMMLLVGSVSTAQAAPGMLSQQPLFLQTAVSPNIFFLNDNSGSMAWELLTNDYSNQGLLTDLGDSLQPAFTHNPSCGDNAAIYNYILQVDNNAVCNSIAEEEWRGRFFEYNHLYYDPNRSYKPWAGTDANGDPLFSDADVTAAKLNPNDANSATINLLTQSAILVNGARTYYSEAAWTTWCSGKSIAASDCIGWRFYERDTNGALVITWVHTLSAAQKTNFANWFTYHRNREFAAKYALSQAIAESGQARIGYGTINNNSNSIRIDNQGGSHRQDVLTKLFNTTSSGSTPLRTKLMAAGNYYETGDLFGTAETSPILPAAEGGTCQSNNTILMTDGYYNGSNPRVNGVVLGNIDGDNGAPFADTYSNSLADVAMYYYERDLAAGAAGQARDLPNDYPATAEDPATHQHMNTYTISFGLPGTLDPTTTDINADGFAWPEPVADSAALIDDLFHAAVNGHGKFLSAADPDKLVQSLSELVRDITGKSQSANAVATSSFQLKENSKTFFSRFTSGSWSGELLAHSIDGAGKISVDPAWNAATALENNNNRTIFTNNNQVGTAFLWNNLNQAQQDDLTAADTTTGIGAARLAYLRGTNNTNFSFRTRDTLLGDIVDSSPVYVGAPASPYPDIDPFGEDNGKRYYNFWNTNKNRSPVIYVGANDGMLHGFDASNGEEVMAYVPATVFPNLHELTRPDYSHRFYVDQTPVIGDAFFAPQSSGATDWHTVLVSGLGSGGRGLFALDITNPNNFVEAKADEIVLWEFNSNDDVDLGYTLSQPVIGMTEEGRWAVFVGNGYNSDNGLASLFIIYLDADPTDGWDLNTDYRKISTGVGTALDKNGLSSPAAVDSNGDGYIDRVYAGDLQGNMWAFNLTGNNVANWGSAYVDGNSNPQPLFQAINAAGETQAITVKPSVIRHPFQPTQTSTTPNLMVLFGSGQYLVQGDLSSTQTQSFYGIWDKGQAYDQDSNALTRSNLIGQTITSGVDNNIEARITSDTYVPYGEVNNTQRFGWYVDLDSANANTGERVISNAVVFNDTVFFSTYTPDSNTCATGGSSWFMFLNAANGGHPSEPMISINNDLLLNENDLVTLGNYSNTAPSGLKINTLGMPALDLSGSVLLHTENGISRLGANIGESVISKRISWREMRAD